MIFFFTQNDSSTNIFAIIASRIFRQIIFYAEGVEKFLQLQKFPRIWPHHKKSALKIHKEHSEKFSNSYEEEFLRKKNREQRCIILHLKFSFFSVRINGIYKLFEHSQSAWAYYQSIGFPLSFYQTPQYTSNKHLKIPNIGRKYNRNICTKI